MDREKNTTAREPAIVSLIKRLLSSLINSRLHTGSAKTAIPTAAGIEISIEKRTAAAILFKVCSLSPADTALVRDGIREEERALETATGILNNS